MKSQNVSILVQADIQEVLRRTEEQSSCIAWDIYDCVALEQILVVARKVAAKSLESHIESPNSAAAKPEAGAQPCGEHNISSNAIALVCEVGKLIDDKGDLPLWAYRNQARIRTVCIAQQHT